MLIYNNTCMCTFIELCIQHIFLGWLSDRSLHKLFFQIIIQLKGSKLLFNISWYRLICIIMIDMVTSVVWEVLWDHQHAIALWHPRAITPPLQTVTLHHWFISGHVYLCHDTYTIINQQSWQNQTQAIDKFCTR